MGIRSFSGHTGGEKREEMGEKRKMKARHFGALGGALCAAAGLSMLALSGAGAPEEYCSLREYEGRVAIYAPGAAALPREITAIAVRSLPVCDREALRGGIAVYSREELYARLEDFGS